MTAFTAGWGGITGTGCQLTTAWGVVLAMSITGRQIASVDLGTYYRKLQQWRQRQPLLRPWTSEPVSGTRPRRRPVATKLVDWSAGTRLQWDVTKSFYLGVEAMYRTMTGASQPAGTALPTAAIGTIGSATGFQSSTSAWNFTLRMHKDFLP